MLETFPIPQHQPLTIGEKRRCKTTIQLHKRKIKFCMPNEFLAKHQSGNYGDICKDDWEENELSVKEGFRILSSYKTSKDVKLWLITEADRSATTVLLPSEY